MARGVEPDSAFYFSHLDWARGAERVDLEGDPAPDLVIEVNVTSPSLERLPIYAAFGVPEVWRYAGGVVQVLALDGDSYRERPDGVAMPRLTAARLNELLASGLNTPRLEWLRTTREWARGMLPTEPLV